MKLKDISSIIITAKDGVMHFEDDQKDLKYYGVKCIYDQKNDAEICESICFAIERIVNELVSEGIIVNIPKIGEMNTQSIEYKHLQKTNNLVKILKEGSTNSLIANSQSITSQENGSYMLYTSNTKDFKTWSEKLIDFAYNLDISRNLNSSNDATEMMTYIRKRDAYRKRTLGR